MGCGSAMVKYILFFFNLFFVLSGLALLGLGIGIQLRVGAVLSLVDNVDLDLQTAPIATMVLGAVVFFIAFLGCCGSIKQNYCMLLSYAVLMVVLLLLKVSLAVVVFTGRDGLVDSVPTVLSKAFTNNITEFHDLELTLSCCGTTGAEAYGASTLPATCCGDEICTAANAYPGCNAVLSSAIRSMTTIIGSMAISVAALELVAVVFALCLANHIRNTSRRNRY